MRFVQTSRRTVSSAVFARIARCKRRSPDAVSRETRIEVSSRVIVRGQRPPYFAFPKLKHGEVSRTPRPTLSRTYLDELNSREARDKEFRRCITCYTQQRGNEPGAAETPSAVGTL